MAVQGCLLVNCAEFGSFIHVEGLCWSVQFHISDMESDRFCIMLYSFYQFHSLFFQFHSFHFISFILSFFISFILHIILWFQQA